MKITLKTAEERSAKSLVREAAIKSLTGAAITAGAIGAHAAIKHALKPGDKHFKAMVDHAGDEFHTMEPHQKSQAKKFYHAIAKHSPTVAKDPIAAWNHTKHLIQHPSSYQPQTIEQLQDVETSKPRLGLGK